MHINKTTRMIYLLRSPAWDNKIGFSHILKIGYTGDSRNKFKAGGIGSRERSYKSHNPTSQMLLKLPGYSKDVEEGLHDLFSTHRYKGMDEWYFYVPEIIEFFSSPDLPQKLKEIETRGKRIREEREWKKKRTVYYYLLKTVNSKLPETSFPKNASTEKEWMDQLKSLLSYTTPFTFIQFEKLVWELEAYDELCKDVLYRIATLKSINKRVDILKELENDSCEEILDLILKKFLDTETREAYDRSF